MHISANNSLQHKGRIYHRRTETEACTAAISGKHRQARTQLRIVSTYLRRDYEREFKSYVSECTKREEGRNGYEEIDRKQVVRTFGAVATNETTKI